MPIVVETSRDNRHDAPALVPVVDSDELDTRPRRLRIECDDARAFAVEQEGVHDDVLLVNTEDAEVTLFGDPRDQTGGDPNAKFALGIGVTDAEKNRGLYVWSIRDYTQGAGNTAEWAMDFGIRVAGAAPGGIRIIYGVRGQSQWYEGDGGYSHTIYGVHASSTLFSAGKTFTAGKKMSVIGGLFSATAGATGGSIAADIDAYSAWFLNPTTFGSLTGTVTKYAARFGGDLLLDNGADLALGTGAGTMIGTGSTQKLGFWGTAPVTRPAANADTSGASLAQLETEVNELKALLRTVGLMAT
jgi:hypothetical protein